MHIYHDSLAPKTKTGNATRTFKYYPLGETTYVPKDAKDMVFNIRINTKDFQGYYADVNHPRIPLCQSISTQVEVKGPMPISTGQVQIEGID